MHAARAIAGLIALAAAARSEPARAGLWRDQWIFVGDGGAVVTLVVQRRASGAGEVKAWLGEGGRWRGRLYETFELGGADPADAAAALAAWAERAARPVRASLERADGGLRLAVRTEALALRLAAGSLAPLGEGRDPEGASRYRLARATLALGRREESGWLVVEETPEPRRTHADYGDFTFVAARAGSGESSPIFLAKRSRGRSRFDAVFSRGAIAGVEVEDAAVRVRAAGGASVRLVARDRSVSSGIGPDGRPRRHEVWLLGGAGAGVAFRIIPEASP